VRISIWMETQGFFFESALGSLKALNPFFILLVRKLKKIQSPLWGWGGKDYEVGHMINCTFVFRK
jgi:hypothetical protein